MNVQKTIGEFLANKIKKEADKRGISVEEMNELISIELEAARAEVEVENSDILANTLLDDGEEEV